MSAWQLLGVIMETSRTFYQKLKDLVEKTPVAVGTIVRVRGSVPREVGAKMIIHPLGQHYGTVGGGCGEGEVIRAGLDVLETGRPRLVAADLTEPISMESMGVCGGVMDVYVERWPTPHLLAELIASVEANQAVALLTVIKTDGSYAEALGQRAVIWPDKDPLGQLALGQLEAQVWADARQALSQRQSQLLTYTTEDSSAEVFVEVLRRPPTLVIVGAGHIALPLAELGKMIEFEVVVLDDRPAFANQERFPLADRVLAQPLQETLRHWPIDNDTYIVLVTRGHSHDVECLLEVIDSPACYIGMIGSRRRIKAVFELLEKEQGLDPAKLKRVCSPIGLDIGAETPAEIAVSIIAEVINVYRGGRAKR